MNTLIKILVLFIVSNSSLVAQSVEGHSISVTIENLNNNVGKVYIALYDSQDTFLGKGMMNLSSDIDKNTCRIRFENVPNGVYAISFFHDENENGTMDTNFLGIPKETYGCSNNARGFMGPPKWEDAKFEVNNRDIKQTITL